MKMRSQFTGFLGVFVLIEVVFIVASFSLFNLISFKQEKINATESFQRIFRANSPELAGNLMLGHHELITEAVSALAQREKIQVRIQSGSLDFVSNPLRGSDMIESSFDIEAAGQKYGRISFAKPVDQLPGKPMGPLVLFAMFQVVLLAIATYLVYQWSQTSVIKPLERLVEQARTSDFELAPLMEKGIPQEISAIAMLLAKLWQDYNERSRQAALGMVSAQVSHDIRSPLAALDMVLSMIPEIAEEKRLLIRGSVSRIRDIANNLLEENRKVSSLGSSATVATPTPELSVQLISSLIDGLISEKRMQYRSHIGIDIDRSLDESAYGVFAKLDSVEFKRLLSNLINNSVEALEQTGRIDVTLRRDGQRALLTISDNGKGIPPAILAKLTGRGQTFGKAGGSGLGLYHARSTIENWGGSFEMRSEVGHGTQVLIGLPLINPPIWFLGHLEVAAGTRVVVLDDDTSIHQIWDERFESLGATEARIEILHFSTPQQVSNWMIDNPHDRAAIFLFDYELIGFAETGMDIIESNRLGDRAILVTSRYEEPSIRSRCEKMKVKLIPKGMAAFVPIMISGDRSTGDTLDLALIDDDTLVHTIWQMSANLHGKKIAIFSDAEEFKGAAPKLSRSLPIYIDVSLGNGVAGDQVAREVHANGFSEIYLATGYDPSRFAELSFIRGVVGKSPPFENS